MKIVTAVVGTPSTPGMDRAIRTYEERARRYFRLEVEEVPAASRPTPEETRREESEALRRRVPEELETFALTRRGKGLSSRGLARYLDETGTYGRPGAAFLVGGAHGLAASTLEAADHRLSLSPMTLPHEMARLVLAEQLYRAGTILRGEPYHKGG